MVSAAIAEGFRLIAIQACEDDHLVPERLERRENRRELEIGAHALWQPLVVNNSVWMIDDPDSLDRFRRSVLGGGQCRHHCIQQRQSYSVSDPAKHGPPGNSFLADDHAHDPALLI
jgi:hypothetical protein